MSEYAVELNGVTKKFGTTIAVNNVYLTLETGKIHGIIGRNGSGKSVLFKCICGLMPVTEGKITVLGQSLGDGRQVPKNIGAIIETPGFLPNATGFTNLWYLAKLSGKANRDVICEILEKVGLNPNDKKHVGKYSLGMRQRLGLAQAIMEDPELLILDEPMNGLDNQGVQDMRTLLKEFRSRGKTIILASHSQEDISTLCDTVYQMDAGVLSKKE